MDDELRAALKRGAPDLAYARHFAAPDNPIVGDTLAWRLDRAGVRAVLAYLEGEPDAAVARLEGERDQASAARDLADAILAEVMAQRDRLASELLAAEAERDAARAALDGLLADVEHMAQANHDTHHPRPGDAAEWRECDRGICPGIRRAVARARAASEGA